jgi:hypothetical protein
MANKTTKKDNFNALLNLEQVKANPALVAFIEHELELLAKKAANTSSKPSAKQVENDKIKKEIVTSMLSGKWYRCAEIKQMVPALADGEGTQRTARLCNDLEKDGVLVKTIEKRVVYFALAE